MIWLDRLIAELLAPLAVWVFINGLDDLFLDISYLYLRLSDRRSPNSVSTEARKESADQPQRKIALIIPCWQEHEVIEQMLDHNLSTIDYDNYDIWLGVYPNDAATIAKVVASAKKSPRVRHVVCGHDGPTTKADCLNSIVRGIRSHEERTGEQYEIIQQHDAEDVIPRLALKRSSQEIEHHGMIQFPVLPLRTPVRWLAHGTYCDEFAEVHLKELLVRSRLGGFIPSAGVGTAYRREVIERLAELNDGEPFDSRSLTEDYFVGLQVHKLGYSQLFVVPAGAFSAQQERSPGLVCLGPTFASEATRSYFPRTVRQAIRQRSRWAIGIALQSWQRFGWNAGAGQTYWLWRDRKGLVNHPAAMLANLIFFYAVGRLVWTQLSGGDGHLSIFADVSTTVAWLLLANLCLLFWRLLVRGAFGWTVYGWRHALATPLRAPFSNVISCCSAVGALGKFASARLKGQPLTWSKTEHSYPSGDALTAHTRRLGEILVAAREIDQRHVDDALADIDGGERIGDYLVRKGMLGEAQIQKALGSQRGLTFRRLGQEEVESEALSVIPRPTANHLGVIPFCIDDAKRLWLAGAEVPSEALRQTISRYSTLSLGFVLITRSNFNELAAARLSQASQRRSFRAAGD